MQVSGPQTTRPTLPWGPPNFQNHPQAHSSSCPLDTSRSCPKPLQQGEARAVPHSPPAQSRSLSGPRPTLPAPLQPGSSPRTHLIAFSHSHEPPIHPLLLHACHHGFSAALSSMLLTQPQTHKPSQCEESLRTNPRKARNPHRPTSVSGSSCPLDLGLPQPRWPFQIRYVLSP